MAFFSTKNYDKCVDYVFDIVNFPFFDGDVPHRPSYGVYIHNLRFARVCSHVTDCNHTGKCIRCFAGFLRFVGSSYAYFME